MLSDFIALFQTEFYAKIWHYVTATWPVWLPLFLIWLFMSTWLTYVRRDWLQKQGYVLLEIKIPQNTEKSPAAMEMVIEGIWEDVAGNLTDAYFEGQVRDVFSLEIVSIGGEVRFFIWAFPKWKGIIESRIYAQYPGAEVVEAEDYALKVHFNPETMNLWGITTRLVKPDAYPIKTYIDYELDKNSKEQEEIIDPLAPVIEYLGTVKPGENAWIQIVIQGHRKEGLQEGRLIPKPDWKDGIKKEIKKIVEEESFVKPAEGKPATLQHLTKTQDETIKSIERNAGKLAFDTVMRVLYVAPKEIYVSTRGVGIIGSMRQFGSKNLNGIRPHKFIPGINYPWEDFNNIKRRRNQRVHLESYKRRSFFNPPFKNLFGKSFVLTTEELATIFHLPGMAITTPTLARVPSKKAQAPANLPI